MTGVRDPQLSPGLMSALASNNLVSLTGFHLIPPEYPQVTPSASPTLDPSQICLPVSTTLGEQPKHQPQSA